MGGGSMERKTSFQSAAAVPGKTVVLRALNLVLEIVTEVAGYDSSHAPH